MSPPVRFLLFFALIAAAAIVQLHLIGLAFEKLGLSPDWAYLLLLMALVGGMINVPLVRVVTDPPNRRQTGQEALLPLTAVKSAPHTAVVALNVGGALVPIVFSLYLLVRHPITPMEMLGVVTFVAAVSFLSSAPRRDKGLGMPMLIAPVAAVLMSLCLNREHAASLAYIGASIGVLVGADLMRLGPLRQLAAPVTSIGGAGNFDAVFLAGLFAVVLC